MNIKKFSLILFLLLSIGVCSLIAQTEQDSSLLTIDRIFASKEFRQDHQPPVQWIENGKAYLIIETSEKVKDAKELVRYESKTQEKSIFISAEELIPEGKDEPIAIEDFSLSPDGSKVLIFNNSSRVWRSNTKGDYWVYDLTDGSLQQIGKSFSSSSLMFAKFSGDNQYVAYVHDFNVYRENFNTGEVTRLTFDGNGDIINGTFDWVYEEEFGCRDGFRWSPQATQIAFWQLDASDIGTFYMINNTDSVYSKLIPLQYPKAGQDPSPAKVGIIKLENKKIEWISLPGDPKQNYIPAMQWVNENLLLIQQLNRKQNLLTVWGYNPINQDLNQIYTEKEDTWVDINYPDVTANNWGKNDLLLTDENRAFLRMTETGDWRHVYKVDIETGDQTLITPVDFDVATLYIITPKYLYFNASPENTTQRYLYRIDLIGKGKLEKITIAEFSGINNYNISPDGKYALHIHTAALQPRTVRLISLPDHKTITTLVDNRAFKNKLEEIQMPEVEFFRVTTDEGITIDGRMIKPIGFDPGQSYPVLFHVYGEPWSQVATDSWIGMWNIMMAQKGFIIIDMDNRGTPCLNGSDWRKSIYRKIGRINSRDQALAAKKVLKWDFIDPDRVSVWGWSGGGSMTLNLMFRYPEVYKTGMAVAPVSNQLIYDNIYQERYMGLLQENKEDFIAGSPITYSGGLEGNLLIIHGTGDDNVHYQSTEMLVDELIRQNKQFDLMAYPNRSHGIYEGKNTRRHLYTLLTDYLIEHNFRTD
ncbi:MAG: DPP IV N-terminal domain-containing protein [Bacteroidales bacterium]|nr:DPP IV N-terminal domain-containing protein [Bacteroidales bacterium]MCF8343410.1 DPP IV N-terminal domain-containing protein [Bacteroidales bacterium]MCF8349850.1 DPP IV N-terminal domain-containing protein [Bacteroidales bacterium]MCF8375554.1 DPP IV N-terminal domain-containing protein [Bacteroidales bacterium]MCF8399953.1 DPP IV N-terminal domain-containing protein [Bacteroidales bacterium]